MPLEDIGSVEALFSSRAGRRAEATDHGALVMSQGMSVLVVLSCEALDVVFASRNRALLRSGLLVSPDVCLQVLDDLPAIRKGALALL